MGFASFVRMALSAFLGAVFSYAVPKAADVLIPTLAGNPLAQHPVETCFVGAFCACVGFFIGRADISSPCKKLAKAIPSLSRPERAVLLLAYSCGEVWAGVETAGPASSLLANGYLALTYSGGVRGDCYILPADLRKEISGRRPALEALKEAEPLVLSWDSDRE